MSKKDEDDIWCCCCGDRTYYAVLEERVLEWFKEDKARGIGICLECSKVLEKRHLVLPESEFKEDKNV